jgi:hypothetical protein
MNPDSTNKRIKELRGNVTRPVESAPAYQIIGLDGSGWYQQVGHDHDAHSNKADLAELREQMREKIAWQRKAHNGRPQLGLFNMLELAIVRSDSAVFRCVDLMGVKPSDGLYEKIKAILVAEDDLDPMSPLWKLLGVSTGD